MANENNNQNSQNQNNDSVEFKNLEANTMESDKQSIKEQGGNEPKPYNPSTNEGDNNRPNPNDSFTPPSVPQPPSTDGGSSGVQPPQDISSGEVSNNQTPPKKPGNKMFLIILISIIVIGGGVAAYIILTSDNGAPVEVPAPNEEVEEENEVIEEEENQEEVSTSTEETMEEEVEEHVSLLTTSADSVLDVTVDPVTRVNLIDAVNAQPDQTPSLYEFVIRDFNEDLVGFSEVASALAPSVFSQNATSSFNEDATYYTYHDENGSWFGIVVSVEEESNEEAMSQVSLLEENIEEIKNFFISDPGNGGDWADGNVSGIETRYITFDNGAFNYGWSGNTLIISTSYPAFLEISERL